ncbi:MAG: hypothetical protein ACXIVF_18155 [Rhizobiaceae bacterium]
MSRALAGAAIALAALLQACQSGSPSLSTTAQPGKSAALRNMEPIAVAAHRCWFASGDPAFREYSFANELDSHSGRPRFLIVPRADYGGRPLLVVQAEGPQGNITAFGPLLDQPVGNRVQADIARWRTGGTDCGQAA